MRPFVDKELLVDDAVYHCKIFLVTNYFLIRGENQGLVYIEDDKELLLLGRLLLSFP